MSLDELESEVFFRTEGNFIVCEDSEDGVLIVYSPNSINEKSYSGETIESVYKKMLKDLK